MSWPSDKVEFLLRENFSLVSPLIVHSFSSVSKKPITMKRNITGAKISPCLTPNLKSIREKKLNLRYSLKELFGDMFHVEYVYKITKF